MKYFLLFVILFALSNIYIKLAKRCGIVDIPNNRSSHLKETVRGGGIIIPISLLSWFIFSGFQYPMLFTGLIIISLISFLDDLSQVSHKLRLFVHCGVIMLLFSEIQLYRLPLWTWFPALIISVGAINAFNFMDGINGITGGYSLSVIVGIWFVNNFQVMFIDNELIYYLMISIVVFSFFNFRTKAKCFAGDVGSISIAYIIVFLLAKLIIQSENWLYILFLSIYGVDTGLTFIYRIKEKEDIFKAHRKHLYQLLVNENKISHLKVAAIYAFLQLIICIIIFIVSDNTDSLFSNLITGFGILSFVAIAYFIIRYNIYTIKLKL